MLLAPQREDQFHINLVCFPSPAFKFTLANGVLIPMPVTGDSSQWTTSAPKFCFCCFCGTNPPRKLPSRGVWTLENELLSLCTGHDSLENRKERAGTWQLSPGVGHQTGDVSHVEYIRAKMAKSALAGVWPWKKETFIRWAPAQLQTHV